MHRSNSYIMLDIITSIIYAIPALLLLLAMVYGIIRLIKLIINEFRNGKEKL